jgi:hypothetical protein
METGDGARSFARCAIVHRAQREWGRHASFVDAVLRHRLGGRIENHSQDRQMPYEVPPRQQGEREHEVDGAASGRAASRPGRAIDCGAGSEESDIRATSRGEPARVAHRKHWNRDAASYGEQQQAI